MWGWLSRQRRVLHSPAWSPSFFACSCCGAFVFPFPSPVASAGGRLLDALGHHRAACARAGVLGRRGVCNGKCRCRICREAGGQSDHQHLRARTAPNALDSRRLEVVADGLLLFGGAQLAVDTTMVSPLLGDGSTHRGAAEAKKGTHISRARSRARLVVLAMEVGGRWSPEALTFIRFLAKAKARHEPNLMRRAGLADVMVFSPGMCCCPRARHVALGTEGLRGRRWRCASLARGGG